MKKTAIITGASGGIGSAISRALIDENIQVALIGRTNEKALKDLANYAKKAGVNSAYYLLDIADTKRVEEVYQDICQSLGSPAYLINNAGTSLYKLIQDCSEDDFDSLISNNLKGMFNFSKAVIPDMIKSREGNIINISSIWGASGSSMEVLYSMTKGGINAYTKALAKELAPSNIRVNAIAPGVIDTRMNDIFDNEEKSALLDEIPLSRFGTGSDISKLVLFLISENSSYITGQIITADGGWY